MRHGLGTLRRSEAVRLHWLGNDGTRIWNGDSAEETGSLRARRLLTAARSPRSWTGAMEQVTADSGSRP